MSVPMRTVLATVAIALLAACGGGDGGSRGAGEVAAQQGGAGGGAGTTAAANCTGSCADTPTALTVADVQQVIAQAVAEARARSDAATIAVVDRVGNVLGVFRMTGADAFVRLTTTADGSAPVVGGLESVNIVPAELAAIAKAITGAYLSSEGNAFSTRTASQIVQEHFNPGEFNQPSGPLFGVQFSQLACGDFVTRFVAGAGSGIGPPPGPGPRRSPLGLAADPGGLPLYKGGTPVGGIGVIADGIYGLDKDVSGFDADVDESIATAGSSGFAAPVSRRADVITLGGKSGRFSEAFAADLLSVPASAPAFAKINGPQGALVGVRGYYDGGVADLTAAGNAARVVLAGVAFGQPASGIRPASAGEFQVGGRDVDAFVFVDQANQNRFPPRAGLDQPGGVAANALSAAEVRAVLANAIAVANRSRAQIRQPDGSQVRVTVSVVDSNGNVLGMARTRDAPVFGADVSLQKARTAAFWSGSGRVGGTAPAVALRGVPDPVYLGESPLPPNPATLVTLASPRPDTGAYAAQLQQFLGLPALLEANGPPLALTDRAIGNLARPHYPDGPTDTANGPLSKPRGEWSVFSVGVQLDLVYNALIQHIAFVLGVVPDVGTNCTGVGGLPALFATANPIPGLANGLQIFPGGVPVYRGNVLVGGVGVSGDGVDQDDMVAFLGVHNAGGGIHNAPGGIRADGLDFGDSVQLRYVSCPQAPFLDTSDDDVCNGK
jgi:uncharacterized protein GlcG (DUF336 family)